MNQLNRIDIGYNFCSIAPLELCNSIRVTLKLAACFFTTVASCMPLELALVTLFCANSPRVNALTRLTSRFNTSSTCTSRVKSGAGFLHFSSGVSPAEGRRQRLDPTGSNNGQSEV